MSQTQIIFKAIHYADPFGRAHSLQYPETDFWLSPISRHTNRFHISPMLYHELATFKELTLSQFKSQLRKDLGFVPSDWLKHIRVVKQVRHTDTQLVWVVSEKLIKHIIARIEN